MKNQFLNQCRAELQKGNLPTELGTDLDTLEQLRGMTPQSFLDNLEQEMKDDPKEYEYLDETHLFTMNKILRNLA